MSMNTKINTMNTKKKKNFIVEKRFSAAGLRCHIIFSDMGHRCGYVTIPECHPLFGAECRNLAKQIA